MPPRRPKNGAAPAPVANPAGPAPAVVAEVDPEDEGAGKTVSLKESGGFLDSESKRVAEVAMRQVERRKAGEKEVKLDADMEVRFWQAKELYPRSNVVFRQISPHESDNIPPRRMDFFNNFGDAVAHVRDTHWNFLPDHDQKAVYTWTVKDDGHPGWTKGKMTFPADPDWLRKKNGAAAPQETPMNPQGGPPGYGYPPQGPPQGGYYPPQAQVPQAPQAPPVGVVQNGYQWNGQQWIWVGMTQPVAPPVAFPPPPPPGPPPQQQPQQAQPQPQVQYVQPPPPPPNDALTMQLVGQLSEERARSARAEEHNRVLESRLADLERRISNPTAPQQPPPQVVRVEAAPAPVQQPQQPPSPYFVGQIVNGYQWSGREWVWLAQQPAQSQPQPQQPAQPPPAPVDPIEGLEKTVSVAKRAVNVVKSFARELDPEPDEPPKNPDEPPFPVAVKEVGPMRVVAVDGEWDKSILTAAAFNADKIKGFVSDSLKEVRGMLRDRVNDVKDLANVEAEARRKKIEDTNAAADALERLNKAKRETNQLAATPAQMPAPVPAPAPQPQVQQAPPPSPPVQEAPQPPPVQAAPPPPPSPSVPVYVPMNYVVEDPPPKPEPAKAEGELKPTVETQGEAVQT